MDLQIGRAVKIVARTTAYVFYRAVIYGTICVAVAIGLGLLALIGKIFGSGAAGVLLVIALIAGGFGFRFLREYVLYLLQAGHIALITEIVEKGELPSGISQTAWAKERVMHFFKEVSVLALVDQLVKGIINTLNRTLFNVLTVLPIPGLESLAQIAQRIVHYSLTYIDESVIAYTFKTGNENVFEAAQAGVIVYCQSWKTLLKNAVALTLLSFVFIIVATVVFMIPLGLLALALPATWGTAKFALFILALFLGFSAKWILFDPIACTSTLLAFLKEAETTPPDPEWEARIQEVSDQFRTLKDKAVEKMQEMAASGTPSSETPEAVASAEAPSEANPASDSSEPTDSAEPRK